MTGWIDFFIYAVFLVGLWFIAPRTQLRLAIPLLADRNAEWLEAYPEIVEKMSRRRWFLSTCYGLGAVSIALLLSVQLGLWTPHELGEAPLPGWVVLWEITMASLFLAIIVGGSVGLVTHIRLMRKVPVAERRQANLERRSIDDYVPRWIRYGTYLLVLANLGAWVVVAGLDLHSSPVFWTRLAILFGLSGFFYVATAGTVHRRPNALDRIFGPGYRRGEVRYTFSMQILPPIIGAVRLYEEVTDSIVFDINRAMQLAIVLFITYGLWRFARLAGGGGLSPRSGRQPV